ncbi:MAG TPA: hypothetical protein VGL38_16130 [bacterium]|jgi:hypothetical protein
MTPIKRITVDVTPENVWFVERYLNVFDFADIFPEDAFSIGSGKGNPVTLHTDLGFDIVTDIDQTKMQIRNRSRFHGWMRWTGEKALRVGDRIVIEKLGERDYSLQFESSSNGN